MFVKVPLQELWVLWSIAKVVPTIFYTQRYFSRLLSVCVKLDACSSSGQCFSIRRWASFTLSLWTETLFRAAVSACLWAGPRSKWVHMCKPIKRIFLDCFSLMGVLKLDILRAHLSSVCLNNYDAQCEHWTLCSSERSSRLRVPTSWQSLCQGGSLW